MILPRRRHELSTTMLSSLLFVEFVKHLIVVDAPGSGSGLLTCIDSHSDLVGFIGFPSRLVEFRGVDWFPLLNGILQSFDSPRASFSTPKHDRGDTLSLAATERKGRVLDVVHGFKVWLPVSRTKV